MEEDTVAQTMRSGLNVYARHHSRLRENRWHALSGIISAGAVGLNILCHEHRRTLTPAPSDTNR